MLNNSFNSIEEIIEDLACGKMIVLLDAQNRENEGDLVICASSVTPEAINFMSKYGRGLICMPIAKNIAKRLNLPLMIKDNTAKYGTKFTVSIGAKHGVTTGISAFDRAKTVLTAVDPKSKPEDLTMPGHIFPLIAADGGVLVREGHTEASCDLAKLANKEPAAVICEILSDDGTMARRDELLVFAKQFGLKIGTIEDLIQFRQKKMDKLAARAGANELSLV